MICLRVVDDAQQGVDLLDGLRRIGFTAENHPRVSANHGTGLATEYG
jgi:hypothetical protein